MNVGELIEQLKAFDPALRVVVRGTDGVNDVSELIPCWVIPGQHDQWLFGRDMLIEQKSDAERGSKPIKYAVEIYG